MRKRPLCLAAVILLLIIWLFPKEHWYKMPMLPSGETVCVTGTVGKREQKEDKQVYYLKNCLEEQTGSEFSMLAYIKTGDIYPIGCRLSLYGTIYHLNKAGNPGQFDAESYYQSQGICYTFQTEAVLECTGKSFLREEICRWKEAAGERLMQTYTKRDGGILKAVLLGDKSSLREEDQLLYQKNGISHLLAISGLHISMIGVSFYKLLRKCYLNFWEAGLPSAALLLLYGMMTGFGISTIRAVCMFLVFIFGDILGRTYDMASALALAAILILLKNPLQARQAGFLLSFGAVLGICMVYPVLQSVFQTKRRWSQSLLFSLSISMVTFPLSVHFFYEYSLYSILLNFIVIPCMPFVMGFGGAGLLFSGISLKLGTLLGMPAHWILSVYEGLGKWIVSLPFSVLRMGAEKTWQLVIYYLLLLLTLLLLWYGRRRAFAGLLPIALLIVSLRFRSGLTVTMLDVGQGDCLFLRLPDQTTCLIDGGSTSVKQVGTYRILPYLKYEGVDRLDYVIFSHLDQDHMNGILELVEMSGTLDGVSIGQILFPDICNPEEAYKKLWGLAEEKEIPVGTIGEGDRLEGEDVTLQCLYPVKGRNTSDKNNSSTVLLLSYEKFSMLFSGDLGQDGERELLKKGRLQDVDVWKVSHHGSKYSGTESFLEKIAPNVSLISVGKNTYGHPSRELLDRLERKGCLVRDTLSDGALMLQSDGETYTLSLQRETD